MIKKNIILYFISTLFSLLIIVKCQIRPDFLGGFYQKYSVNSRFYDNLTETLSNFTNICTGRTNIRFGVGGDTHFATNLSEFPHFTKLSNIAINSNLDFFVLLGDITDHGDKEEFNIFNKYKTSFPIPIYPVLGNHDLWYSHWTNYKKYIGRSVYSFYAGNSKLIILDSANGDIGDDQLSWLYKELSANINNIFICTHFPISKMFFSHSLISSREECYILYSLFDTYNVKAYFAGHNHTYNHERVGNTDYFISGQLGWKNSQKDDAHFLMVIVNGTNIIYKKISLK